MNNQNYLTVHFAPQLGFYANIVSRTYTIII